MISTIKRFFDQNEKEIKRLRLFADRVNRAGDQLKDVTVADLPGRTQALRAKVTEGTEGLSETDALAKIDQRLEEVAEEAFALCRIAGEKVMGMRHFDVQLIGGKVMQEGRIAEMKTGEGKTLTATLPLYLNALAGRGAHLVTVNDYLAQRDRDWMFPLFQALGMSVGVIKHGLNDQQRHKAYACDITYGTNNEFGFDYLRDNMEMEMEGLRQRGFFYAIVDEVDSILIDEARTPLIISGQAEKSTELYYRMAELLNRLGEEDIKVEEKHHSAVVLESGIHKLETWLGIDNLYGAEHTELAHLASQAVRARGLFKKDVHYVVREGEVVIVDEFTGRLMFGRRYSDGLHQAIEARERVVFKEVVDIQRESLTLATVTFQNYFRMYHRLAGMTGTAKTEEDEFRKIYGCDVVQVPTNKPMVRDDSHDAVYKNQRAKAKAVVAFVKELYEKKQPVLFGTVSIEKSEFYSDLLKHEGVPHTVLNAKFHEREAHIVAQAGRSGSVTIATNMAGRGTDIVLGGNPKLMAVDELERQGKAREEISDEEWATLLEQFEQTCAADHNVVIEAGGLAVVGTERHESRRIDNQLRGRSGRQGDPGLSKFFVALDDDLMRLFGSDKLGGMMERLGMTEDEVIEHPWVSKSIESAQKKVEAQHFGSRKQLLEFDDVMNVQRSKIYSERRQILEGAPLRESLKRALSGILQRMVHNTCPPDTHPDDWDLEGLSVEIREFLPFIPEQDVSADRFAEKSADELTEHLSEHFLKLYEEKEALFGDENMQMVERYVFLRCIDEAWVEHLSAMDALKEGIFLRGYGQEQPIIAYQKEAKGMFDELLERIRKDALQRLLLAMPHFVTEEEAEEEQAMAPIEAEPRYSHVTTNREPEAGPVTVRGMKKPKPNDACPCGSGKKFKKCYGTSGCGLFGKQAPWEKG